MNRENRFLLEFDKERAQVVHLDYLKSEKFSKDKFYSDSDSFLIILDGVILNKRELLADSQFDDWEVYLTNHLQDFRSITFAHFIGSFWGVIIDKSSGESIVFGDQIGSKQVFYTSSKHVLIVSTNSARLTGYLKNHDTLRSTLNEQAAYFLLSFGYVIEDFTMVQEIARLQPGCYLKDAPGKHALPSRYHTFVKEAKVMSDEEAIEGIDFHFRNAVKRAFEKDKEYNYRHLVALSGGFDSRMTTSVAHEMGYTDQANITFSQTGYPVSYTHLTLPTTSRV